MIHFKLIFVNDGNNNNNSFFITGKYIAITNLYFVYT